MSLHAVPRRLLCLTAGMLLLGALPSLTAGTPHNENKKSKYGERPNDDRAKEAKRDEGDAASKSYENTAADYERQAREAEKQLETAPLRYRPYLRKQIELLTELHDQKLRMSDAYRTANKTQMEDAVCKYEDARKKLDTLKTEAVAEIKKAEAGGNGDAEAREGKVHGNGGVWDGGKQAAQYGGDKASAVQLPAAAFAPEADDVAVHVTLKPVQPMCKADDNADYQALEKRTANLQQRLAVLANAK